MVPFVRQYRLEPTYKQRSGGETYNKVPCTDDKETYYIYSLYDVLGIMDICVNISVSEW